jgi:uncharacterized RmlC-like cupin family protein
MSEKPAAERPNDPTAIRFERPPQYYFVWEKSQGIPIHDTFHVPDLATVETAPWELFGGKGCFVNLTDSFLVGSFVLEIPPGQSLKPMKHLFEGTVYIVEGEGETVIEQKGAEPRTLSWRARSLFAPPLNATYTHRNRSADRPARLLVVNNAPLVLSLYHDEEFVFGSDHAFKKRDSGDSDYFEKPAEYLGSRLSRINFIRDVGKLELYDWEMRGKGAKTTFLSLSDNTLAAHISSFDAGSYKKAHRHGAGAHVVILDGEGYSLLWKDGDEPQRVEWQAGTMFAPPEWWWHQHFNLSGQPARYLAIRNNNPEHPLRMGMPRFRAGESQFGQMQIEFEEEDPQIYRDFAKALAERGVPNKQQEQMPAGRR